MPFNKGDIIHPVIESIVKREKIPIGNIESCTSNIPG